MKVFLASALALLGAIGVAVTGEVCDLATIKSKLESNTTISAKVLQAEDKCLDKSGINIFNITTFPTSTQAKAAQASGDCSTLVNYVNGNQNIDSQCTIQIGNETIIYGRLISDFLDGKTGNESESDSGSSDSGSSDSGSSESGSNTTSPSTGSSTSGSTAIALSFVAYGAVAAIAAALH